MSIWFSLLLTLMAASARPDTAAEVAVKLVNQGNVEKGIESLRDHLARDANDVDAWVVLGKILDFDGRPEEAVAEWSAGLKGEAADVPLLVAVGEIRQRQGRDGPNITYRRGMVGAHPSKPGDDEAAYQAKHLAEAAAAFDKARKFLPADRAIASALATVYTEQKRFDAAAALWKSLADSAPKDADLRLKLALATRDAGRPDEAMGQLERAIGLDPHLAAAQAALAEIQATKGLKAEADLSRRRAEFYEALPPFCTLEFSEANRGRLAELNSEQAVKKLVDDPSDEATQLLAVLCWSHPHNVLEARAFESLEARGARTTPVLRAILDEARSTCTIRGAAHILARRKVDGLFEFLARRLPGDLRMLGMNMDIAGSLDELGDPRAVGPLVELLNPADADAGTNEGLLSDRMSAQGRAALALGAFATPESTAALKAALAVPRLRPYAAAALYRQARQAGQLAELDKAIGRDDLYVSSVVGPYLVAKVGTAEAKALAGKWREWREEAEARRKAQAAAER